MPLEPSRRDTNIRILIRRKTELVSRNAFVEVFELSGSILLKKERGCFRGVGASP